MALDINMRFFWPDLATRFEKLLTAQSELKELMMTAKEDFQREVKESREQAKAVVEGLNTLRAVVADLQAQLKAAANGLTAEEATQAAADLDAAQQEVSAALAGGGVTVPADPGEPVVVPASQG